MRFEVAEMTKWPLIGPVMEHALFNGHKNGDTLFYLPKDRVVINQQIEDQQNVVIPSEVVTHFIEEASHIFLMITVFAVKLPIVRIMTMILAASFLVKLCWISTRNWGGSWIKKRRWLTSNEPGRPGWYI